MADSGRGAELQVHNNELVDCIEELREKRGALARQIQAEEGQRERVQQELQALTVELSQINNSLSRKMASKAEYDRVIAETEAAYVKILSSSQALLQVLKRHTLQADGLEEDACESQRTGQRAHWAAATEAGCDGHSPRTRKEVFQIRTF